ncbi:MAG TPA: DNA polymerase III subunit delta' [Caulobacteraceae bacterium]|nr:DNA polymerase III subunit delta' [Caulobacteraceae bacterium]
MTQAIAHPREVFDWAGDEAHERAFLDALERGRLHHAWLVIGPEGVGKATFAYRAARRLLGARPEPSLGPLGSAPGDPVSRQVLGRAHPDLMVLQRDPEDGRARRGIPVDEARALPEFFAKSPASAPYRVAIIDTADDLNNFGANAVLKTLEEPPERGVLFLISHAPGGLLATIRSRCRRVRLDVPEPGHAARWVAARAEVAAGDAERLLAMARGAPGGAWRLAAEGALEADRLAQELLAALPDPDERAMLAIADGFRGSTGLAKFQLFFNRLADRVHAMAASRAAEGERGLVLDRWVEVWDDLVAAPLDAEAINLDRADLFFTTLARLKAISRA